VKPGNRKYWRQLPAHEYAALFPASPPALRRIAFHLRRLGANGIDLGYDYQPRRSAGQGRGNKVFTINQWELAEHCYVSLRTLRRYLPVFERYGIIEVKRWRYREFGPSPNSYRLYFGNVIPADWRDNPGKYAVSPRDKRGEGKRGNTRG
jgi:hypothetical protein